MTVCVVPHVLEGIDHAGHARQIRQIATTFALVWRAPRTRSRALTHAGHAEMDHFVETSIDLLQAQPLEDDASPKLRKPRPPPQPSSFSCPRCNATLGVSLQKKRTVVRCPECGNEFVVQRPPPPPAAAAKAAEAAEAAEEPEWLAAAALQLRKEQKQARRRRAEKEQRDPGDPGPCSGAPPPPLRLRSAPV